MEKKSDNSEFKTSWNITLKANSHEEGAKVLMKISKMFNNAINDIDITTSLGQFQSKRIR